MNKIIITLILIIAIVEGYSQSPELFYDSLYSKKTAIEFLNAFNKRYQNTSNSINAEFMTLDSIFIVDSSFTIKKRKSLHESIINQLINELGGIPYAVNKTVKTFEKDSLIFIVNKYGKRKSMPKIITEKTIINNVQEDEIKYEINDFQLKSISFPTRNFAYNYIRNKNKIEKCIITDKDFMKIDKYYSFSADSLYDSIVKYIQPDENTLHILNTQKYTIQKKSYSDNIDSIIINLSNYKFNVLANDQDSSKSRYIIKIDSDEFEKNYQFNEYSVETDRENVVRYIFTRNETIDSLFDNNKKIIRTIHSERDKNMKLKNQVISNFTYNADTKYKTIEFKNTFIDNFGIKHTNDDTSNTFVYQSLFNNRILKEIQVKNNDTSSIRYFTYSQNNKIIRETSYYLQNNGLSIKKVDKEFFYEIPLDKIEFIETDNKIECKYHYANGIAESEYEFNNNFDLYLLNIDDSLKQYISQVSIDGNDRNIVSISLKRTIFENKYLKNNTAYVSIPGKKIEGVDSNHFAIFDYTIYLGGGNKPQELLNDSVIFRIQSTTGIGEIECMSGIKKVTIVNILGQKVLEAGANKDLNISLFEFDISDTKKNLNGEAETFIISVVLSNNTIASRIILVNN